MRAGIAAGHPATAEAGIAILRDGGTAADAAVAAALASCVAETVMTGLLGGGHGIYWDADAREVFNLDFFVAVPGLEGESRELDLIELDVPFGAELVHYAVGPASCAVPGVPAGLAALRGRYGRMDWDALVEPAMRLARDGVALPPAHASCLAMLAPVMTMDAGERIYSPGGALLQAGETLQQPGLVQTLELIAREGPETFYAGTVATRLVALMEERGGVVTREDLLAYKPRWAEPVEVDYCGTRFVTRAGLSGVAETLARTPPLSGLTAGERVRELVRILSAPVRAEAHTTNLVTADRGGNVCVLTTSLGLGSGDFVPGLDLHLNSMLGEVDLVRGPLVPGERMESMMAPSLALARGSPVLAIGAAGGTRLRTALVGVAAGILDERIEPQDAVDRPRFHPVARTLNAEPGVDEDALRSLEADGWTVRRWPAPHHYFGGVSAIGENGAAADPRRSGAVRVLE